jgi:integrase
MRAVPERYSALVATLALAGLRIGEACALRWRDVDLLGQRIHVSRTFNPKTGEEGPVKTGEARTVDFGQRLLEVLLAHKPEDAGDDDLVFATARRGHMHPSNVRMRAIKPAIEQANRELALTKVAPISENLTPHGLRHTFCSVLVSQGEDFATVAQQMRHSDVATTQRYYTHAMGHRRSGIAERLDETLTATGFRVAFRVANGGSQAPGEEGNPLAA